MPSSWTHAATAVATAALLAPRDIPARTWAAVAVAAVVLDADALPRLWGGGDLTWLGGHRALTHSVTFAVVSGALLSALLVQGTALRLRLGLALAAAIATHGVMDALVTYGGGVQFLAPFTDTRYQSPWKPLGGGIVGDTLAFLIACTAARLLIRRRGQPLPALLDPSFLRTPDLNGRP
jgi:membrane-bound metal-dependent hydrolase YbcI (DUF457 family)